MGGGYTPARACTRCADGRVEIGELAMLRVVSALLSGACVAVGVGMIAIPAGLVTAGIEGLFGVYTWAYLSARRAR